MKEYEGADRSIVIMGHSLGRALATLRTFNLVANGISDIPVTAVVFSCPIINTRNHKILHVRSAGDLVPAFPVKPWRIYVPIQMTQLMFHARRSTHLKLLLWPRDYHNLELVLHVVAGCNGPGLLPLTNPFELKVKRSFVLGNNEDRTQRREDFDEEVQQEFGSQPRGEAPAPSGSRRQGVQQSQSRPFQTRGAVGGRYHESPGGTAPDWKQEMMAELGKRLGNHHSQTPDDLAE
ncbi:Fungal lipase-like domain containing protein [Parasponia andersonii]|uniref:Phospholipase A1 n=1 Tax=Parasponia andersonii TaxID=3476 RepID=A0A2P5DHP1_PARAD|nr:Fungal lipase-like domain containing protein [Parasponia andersonii]